jgi:hypothetical protein
MSALYSEHKDVDGFLYIKFSGENYFGTVDETVEQRVHGTRPHVPIWTIDY